MYSFEHKTKREFLFFIMIFLSISFFSCKSPEIVNITPVTKPRYFYACTLAVGMIWRFKYSDVDIEPPTGVDIEQSGIHMWKLISSAVKNQDTVYTGQEIINDIKISNGDSSVINDTTTFTFVYSYKQVQFNWPFANSTFTIPNHVYVLDVPIGINNKYTLNLEAQFDYNGPTYYYDGINLPDEQNYTLLTLIDFIKP